MTGEGHGESDLIDQLIADWKVARPDLDPSPLALVARVIVIAKYLERAAEVGLEKHRLTLGQFDLLSTIRRLGSKGGMTPSQLLQIVMVSSGGMTSRLDKLEAAGLIERQPDPNDRRGVVVMLTSKGRKVADTATNTRFRDAANGVPPISREEQEQLAGLLRKWLLATIPDEVEWLGDRDE